MKKLFVLLIAFFAMCAFAGAAVTNLGTLTLHEFDGNTGGEMLKITNSVGGYGQIFAQNYTPTFFWSKNTSGIDPEKFNKITLTYDGANITATILNVENPPQSKFVTIPFPGVDPNIPLDMKITVVVNGTNHFIELQNILVDVMSFFDVWPIDPYVAPPSGNQTCRVHRMFNQLDFEISLGAEDTYNDYVTIDFSQETVVPSGEGPIVWFDPCRVTQDTDPDPTHYVPGAVMCWYNFGTLGLNPENPFYLEAACAPNWCTRPIENGCFELNCGPDGEQTHGGLWFKESPCYGMSSILEFPANDAILSEWTSVLTPNLTQTQNTKNMLIMFKPTGEVVENDGGLLYDDDIQTIFEVGGTISGFNVYIDEGYLCMGAWNRVQRYAFKFANPLVRGNLYLAHMEMRHEPAQYDGKILIKEAEYKVRMILNGESSPWYCFKGFQHDDSPSGIGGETHGTTYNVNLGVYDNYARWFDGCIGDVRIWDYTADAFDAAGEYLYFNAKYGTSFTYPVVAPPPTPKASDWKVFDNSPIEGNSGSTFEVYPNPFSNSATLDLRLAEAQNVRVELFDMAGQKVMTVFDGACTKGLNSFPISGTSLLSGVYAVRISGNGFVNMAKVVLTK